MSFFEEVNNVNIFGFTKTVVNVSKLRDDLVADDVFGPLFDYFVTDADKIRVHCVAPATQAQIDRLNSLINNFVEQDLFTTLNYNLSQAQQEGLDIYRQIIALINTTGGLQGYLDDDMIPAVQMIMNLRNMLKDGFFEYTLRFYWTEVKPMNFWDQASEDQILAWIEAAARKYAFNPQETEDFIANYKLVPKGQFPFGANLAP